MLGFIPYGELILGRKVKNHETGYCVFKK